MDEEMKLMLTLTEEERERLVICAMQAQRLDGMGSMKNVMKALFATAVSSGPEPVRAVPPATFMMIYAHAFDTGRAWAMAFEDKLTDQELHELRQRMESERAKP